MGYALNFLAFGTLLPSKSFSAPTFLPSLSQPYLGGKTLFHKLQEEKVVEKMSKIIRYRKTFILPVLLGTINIKLNFIVCNIYRIEPFCIPDVIIGNAVNLPFYFFCRNLFYFFGRYTGIDSIAFTNCPL